MTRDLKKISKVWYAVYIVLCALAILFAVNQVFKLELFGYAPTDTAYLYWLMACYLSSCFLIYPFNAKAPLDRIPFYDFILFFIAVAVNAYLAVHAIDITLYGWSFRAPMIPTVCSYLLWAMVLESLRRTSGNIIFCISALFSFYPLIAGRMPGVLRGLSFGLTAIANSHAMSLNSILGTPLTTVGTLLVGFMVFGVVLNQTGGGKFFNDISMALLGYRRGGAAKVGVVGAALFGSLSGSAISNVVTIGTVMIPTMKENGYESEYAGAIMACSSTGGTIMPPVMGAAAFIMASFMGVPYSKIIIAAAIPSILYYLGLFVQIDAHAGKIHLQGLDRSLLPKKKDVMKEGWPFIFVLVVLFYFLLGLRLETYAPWYASVVLLLIALLRRSNRMSLSGLIDVLGASGKTLIELVSILAGVGLIIGSLSMTGVALAFSRELVNLVGDNLFLMLLAGAVTSFILGMGMSSTACYIFLSIVMAPALQAMGVPTIAAHFYVLYWGIISFITPPVAMAAFAAAKISGADAMKTGLVAMQLGMVTYFIPFLFVYDPRLLAQGSLLGVLYAFLRTALAVFMMACALEGYVGFVESRVNPFERLVMVLAAILLALPMSVAMDLAGAAICAAIFVYLIFKKKRGAPAAPAQEG